MKQTHLIKITDAKFDPLACGKCFSVIIGYDEEICPICGTYIDMSDIKEFTEKEFTKYTRGKS